MKKATNKARKEKRWKIRVTCVILAEGKVGDDAMVEVLKRDYKNSVFIDMFDQEDYRYKLFQTLHPEMTDVKPSDIQTITLKQVITTQPYNDLAFLVKNRLMVFVEAQSTWSINILIRILIYLADTIQEYITETQKDIHDIKKLELPIPEFYIIYTGTAKVPNKISLKNDFFQNEDCPIDLEATVLTAETDNIIGHYIIFCRVLDDQVRRFGRVKKAAIEAINICKNRGVLIEYLNPKLA